MTTDARPRPLVSTREAADMLGCSPTTIRRAAASGVLEPVRLRPGSPFRFRLADLEHLIYNPRPRPEELGWT